MMSAERGSFPTLVATWLRFECLRGHALSHTSAWHSRYLAPYATQGAWEKSGSEKPNTKSKSRQSHQAARNRHRQQLRRLARRSQISRTTLDTLVQSVTIQSETTAQDVQRLVGHDWRHATVPEESSGAGNHNEPIERPPAADWCAVHPSDGPVGNTRKKDDGILLVVKARIFGKECKALIDSGATRSFITPAAVLRCGLHSIHQETLLELADGRKLLSQGQCPHTLLTVSSKNCKVDLTICPLMKNIDVILGINCVASPATPRASAVARSPRVKCRHHSAPPRPRLLLQQRPHACAARSGSHQTVVGPGPLGSEGRSRR